MADCPPWFHRQWAGQARGWQVEPCDHSLTRANLSALEMSITRIINRYTHVLFSYLLTSATDKVNPNILINDRKCFNDQRRRKSLGSSLKQTVRASSRKSRAGRPWGAPGSVVRPASATCRHASAPRATSVRHDVTLMARFQSMMLL